MIPKLRPYQEQAVTAIEGKPSRGVLSLATGTGKTVVAAELIRRRGGRSLFVAHRDELIGQAQDKLAQAGLQEIGVVKAEQDDVGAQHVVASVQTLARENRLRRLLDPSEIFTTVVFDEVHHSGAPSWERVLAAIQSPCIVGLTATPERHDGKPLLPIWPAGIVYQKGLLEMIAAGYLCDLRAIRVGLTNLDLTQVKMTGGDFQEGSLGEALEKADAPEHTVEAYQRWASGRKALVFTPTVALARETTRLFLEKNLKAACVWGEQELDQRREVLRRFASGDLKILVNCAVLLEGYDEPSIDCIICARPTKSRVLYQQMIGRGTRLHPGKEDCLILDMVGVNDLGLQTMESLFNIKEATARAGLRTLLEKIAGQGKEEEKVAEDLDLVAQAASAFRRPYHWVKDTTRYLLPAGDLTYSLQPVPAGWDIYVWERPTKQKRKLYAGLELAWAQGTAEDLVRGLEIEPLVSPGATWRKALPSEKQRDLLIRLGAWREGMTKGQASDEITRRLTK